MVNLLKSLGNDSQPDGPARQPYLTYRPANLQRLAESISWNRLLDSLTFTNSGTFGQREDLRSDPPVQYWSNRSHMDRTSGQSHVKLSLIHGHCPYLPSAHPSSSAYPLINNSTALGQKSNGSGALTPSLGVPVYFSLAAS